LFDLLQPWGGYVYIRSATYLLMFERNFNDLLVLTNSPIFAERVQIGHNVDLNKGITYYLMGDKEQARKYLQLQIDYSLAQPSTGSITDAFYQMDMATSWSYLGGHEKALKASRKAMVMLPQDENHIFGTMIENNHTLLLAMAGKRDEALTRLTDTVDQVEGLTRWELYLSPAWDFFRDDERFNELARPLNLKETGK